MRHIYCLMVAALLAGCGVDDVRTCRSGTVRVHMNFDETVRDRAYTVIIKMAVGDKSVPSDSLAIHGEEEDEYEFTFSSYLPVGTEGAIDVIARRNDEVVGTGHVPVQFAERCTLVVVPVVASAITPDGGSDLARRDGGIDLARPDLATGDGSGGDLATTPDLARPSEDGPPTSPDLAVPPDLTVVGDQAKVGDMADLVDLATTPDLILSCNMNADCVAKTGGACKNGTCQSPSCSDAIKNQDETDVDCGGGKCAKCVAGKVCKIDTDCAILWCNGGAKCAANVGKINIGGEGPMWDTHPAVLNCLQTCQLKFGLGPYHCSTKSDSIDKKSWLQGWGSGTYCPGGGAPAAEDYSLGGQNGLYWCPGAPGCAYSAFVSDPGSACDSAGAMSYCFK